MVAKKEQEFYEEIDNINMWLMDDPDHFHFGNYISGNHYDT